LFEPQKPIGENVGCDAFLGTQEIRVARPPLEHEVANDQQRPRIAEHLERKVHRTIGPPLTFFHGVVVYLRSASPLLHGDLQKASASFGRYRERRRSAYPEVLRWQNRLNGFNRTMFGGCHLNRDVSRLVQEAGFEFDDVQQYYLEGQPKFGGS
jgi:hypothetical protein